MNDDEVVLYEERDAVATLTLNRPERMNAWTYDMEERFFDLLDAADDDPDVRAIVITGAGRGFCAGMDASVLSNRANERAGSFERTRPLTHLLSTRKLTIAAINGGCAGIGLIHALCCDVRFAAAEAKIAGSFTRRGIAPEFGAGWLMQRVVGAGHAADLLLSSRTVTGIEAERVGLVHRAVDRAALLPEARAYAQDVASNCSPRAIAYAKADLLADWTRSRAQAEADAHKVLEREGHAEDFKEGVDSFLEKRPPRFVNVPPRG